MIINDKFFEIMSTKKFYTCLEKLYTWKKKFIISYLNDFYDLLNLILQILEQYFFTLL